MRPERRGAVGLWRVQPRRPGAHGTKQAGHLPVGLQDRYGRDVARCSVGTVDLGAEQVRDGWALDWQHYSHGAYAGQEAEARASLNGIWSGTFENPWDWRHAHSGQEAAR